MRLFKLNKTLINDIPDIMNFLRIASLNKKSLKKKLWIELITIRTIMRNREQRLCLLSQLRVFFTFEPIVIGDQKYGAVLNQLTINNQARPMTLLKLKRVDEKLLSF